MLKYQIFVSSTFEDLKTERDQVIKAILEMGHIPVGMEMFSAADENQWDVIKQQIDQSDYYVVILAHRYGSMDGVISYTEKEYDHAVSRKIPVLGFVVDPESPWPAEWIENNNDIRKRLEAFKSKVSGRMVSYWKNSDDLYARCAVALMKAFSTMPQEGWVRSSNVRTKEMSEEITRLSRENGQLRAELRRAESAVTEEQGAKVSHIVDALRANRRSIYVWAHNAKDWGSAISTNLLGIFEAIAPHLLDEAPNSTLSDALALQFGTGTHRSFNPVPANFVTGYVADFVSLDLVARSTKRHSVSDTKAYWTLTDLGRTVHKSIRTVELLSGISDFEEIPDDEEGDPSDGGSDPLA
jgi:hypothetical protein